jgi:hypothetical protein
MGAPVQGRARIAPVRFRRVAGLQTDGESGLRLRKLASDAGFQCLSLRRIVWCLFSSSVRQGGRPRGLLRGSRKEDAGSRARVGAADLERLVRGRRPDWLD